MQKCKNCKTRCRDDGWCNKCRAFTMPRKNLDLDFKGYNWDGQENKINELVKQYQWLGHQIEFAKTPEKKEKAVKKLRLWKSKNRDMYGYVKRKLVEVNHGN